MQRHDSSQVGPAVRREMQALSRAPVHSKACTFTLSATNRDSQGNYFIELPEAVRHCVSLEIAGFETQSVEQNISEQEAVVTWGEGLRISTGEAPTLYDDVPVFDHEICIKETVDGTDYYFKVGLCPQFNEVSTVLWDDAAPQRMLTLTSNDLATGTNAADWYFSTTRNIDDADAWAAPHYLGPLRALKAQGKLVGMRAYTACMAQRRHVDLTVADVLTVASPAADGPPVFGETQFRVASADIATAYFANVTATDAGEPVISTSALAQGFLCCSPWHCPDIVTMLNYQLASVTNSVKSTDAAGKFNRCATNGRALSNRYEFAYVEGRFHLLCHDRAVDFSVVENTAGTAGSTGYRDILHGNGTAYDGGAQTTSRALLTTASSGTDARTTSLWRAMGFGHTTPATFQRQRVGGGTILSAESYDQYGMRAASQVAWAFETTVPPAYYSAQTFVTALSSAMNGGRPKASAPNAPNEFAATCAFVDSAHQPHTLVLTTGQRTPHEYAASLEFLLNRTDVRGIYYSGHNYAYDETYAQFSNGRTSAGGTVVTADNKRVCYSCVYDRATGKFTISNGESNGHDLINNADTYPTPAGSAAYEYSAPAVSAEFQLSFRAADVQATASSLNVAAVPSPAAFAAVFGFENERVYSGTTLVSPSTSSCAACHVQTLTRGQPNDVNTAAVGLCARPLGDALDVAALAQNCVDRSGAGPDGAVFPQYSTSFMGSVQNDKQLSISASYAPTPSSRKNTVQKSGAADDVPTGFAYDNHTSVAAITAVGNRVSAVAITGSKDMAVGTLLMYGKALVGDTDSPGDALAYVTAVSGDGSGAIDTVGTLFSGSGTLTNPYTTSDHTAYQLNANEDLRVIHGAPSLYDETAPAAGQPITSVVGSTSRIYVQAAAARERVSADGAHSWRAMQATCGPRVGDLVLLGTQQSVVLGANNVGASNVGATAGVYLTITQTSPNGHLITATGVKPDATNVLKGHRYVVQQGTCRTLIDIVATPTTTSFTFAVVERGTGHVFDAARKVRLFGPVVPYLTAMVEEVGQTQLRRTTTTKTDVEGEAVSSWATPYALSDGIQTCVTSVARDGSVLKLRLPMLASYAYIAGDNRQSHPSNLMGMRSMDVPRIQLYNGGPDVAMEYARADTVWPAAGLLQDSVADNTVKLPNEWNLESVSGLLITLEDAFAEQNNVFVGPNGVVSNVVAQITFGARMARTWATVNSKRFAHARLKHLRFKLKDMKGNEYQLRGRTCRITLNLHFR